MRFKVLISLIFGGFIFLGYSNVAIAGAEWPMDRWGTGPIILLPEKTINNSGGVNHNESNTYFSAYVAGNQSGRGGNFTLNINPYMGANRRCDTSNLNGTAIYAQLFYGSDAANAGNRILDNIDCNEGTKVVSIAYSSGVYNSATYSTAYRFRVHMVGFGALNSSTPGERRGYGFTVNSPQADVDFGVTKQSRIVFMRIAPNTTYYNTLIRQQPSWDNNDAGATSSYDYDNFAGNAQDGTAGFSPLSISFGPIAYPYSAATWVSPAPLNGASPGWALASGAPAYRYQPVNTATNQTLSIGFSTAPKNSYYYVIHNLRSRNYSGVTLPFDGGPPGPSATINTGASADNTDSNASTPGNQVNLTVSTSNLVRVTTEQFNWYTEYNRNGGAWNRLTPASGSTSTSIAGPGTVVNEEYNVPGAAGNYCYRIVVTVPGFVSWGPGNDSQVCFNVVQPPEYQSNTAKAGGSGASQDYEKGGPTVTFTHNIIVSTMPCDYTKGTNKRTWVNQVDWSTDQYNIGGASPVTGIGGLVTGYLQFENCGNEVRINGLDSEIKTAQPGNVYEITRYDVNSATQITTLEDAVPGSRYGRKTQIDFSSNSDHAISFLVYEVPFARFFGNDVKVCGSGVNNRFAWDNRTSVTTDTQTANSKKGSFAEYASIYKSNNIPSLTYSGLNSAANIGFPNDLKSNYGGQNCGSGLVTSGTDSDFINVATNTPIIGNAQWNATDRKVIYVNGDTTITQPIIMNTGVFDPDTHPVLVIYAIGNIDIRSNVNQIDAILITGPTGSINTCTKTGGVSDITRNRLHLSPINGCKNPLKINGALISPTINLQRTGGTRYYANTTTSSWKDVGNANDLSTASEIVEFPWYLNFINIGGLVDKTDTKLDAYFALPPRL